MPKITRDWMDYLSLRMQAVILTAIRGCDGAPKEDPSKSILRAFRWVCLNPSDPDFDPIGSTSFMGYTETLERDVETFLGSLDQYPFHFVMHVTHAVGIVGYFHPEADIRGWWISIYRRIVQDNFHMRPETQEMMEERLQDR